MTVSQAGTRSAYPLSAWPYAPTELDQVMTQFADANADILLSTNIVESGIDIPSANTMIIHRADMFGLSQLYQLRGRVAERQRAYAYLTSDPQRLLNPQARRRFEVMQTLDTLGAGSPLPHTIWIFAGLETCWETSNQDMCERLGLSFIKICCVKLDDAKLGVKTMQVMKHDLHGPRKSILG